MSSEEEDEEKKGVSRRQILKGVVVGAVVTAAGAAGLAAVTPPKIVTKTELVTATAGPVSDTIFPRSQGYIFVDPQKCSGCKSCMLACSLVHEGNTNLSRSRIQQLDDPFGVYPTDITHVICRQCPDAPCVKACPVPGALFIDQTYLNVRRIDASKCIGCKQCITACPYTPARVMWNPAVGTKGVAIKCDLCKDTPYWSQLNAITTATATGTQTTAAPQVKLACVEVCPMRCLKFSSEPPSVPGPEGYIVNLRGDGWKTLQDWGANARS